MSEYWNYLIEELSRLLTERLYDSWHLLFINSVWWLWYKNYKQIMSVITVISSLNLKNCTAARSVRCVTLDIVSTSYLVNVVICWFMKTVNTTDYRFFNLLLLMLMRQEWEPEWQNFMILLFVHYCVRSVSFTA